MSEGRCNACRGPLELWRDPYERCRNCRSLQLRPDRMPDSDNVLDVYAQEGYHAEGESRGAAYHQSRIDWIRRALSGRPTPWRLLEVGCGSGLFASAASSAGFDVTAVEPGSRYEDARALLGHRVEPSTWEDILPCRSETDRRYDAIVAWEVVEHLHDPHSFFLAAARSLRPGGVVAVSTPNAMSWSILVLGARDPMLCPDEHLRLFSSKGLRSLMTAAGPAQVQVRGFGHLFPGEVQSGVRRLASIRVPLTLASALSGMTKATARTPFSLGLEGLLRMQPDLPGRSGVRSPIPGT